MSTTSKRPDAGAAVAGLFERPTATGGLAGRNETPEPPDQLDDQPTGDADCAGQNLAGREPRVRLSVELTERELAFLRALSRPGRTGQPRTLGAKFVATGVLAAAIELLADVDVDMYGVHAGDAVEMTARARSALLRAGTPEDLHKEES
jgi:hypothetical protein